MPGFFLCARKMPVPQVPLFSFDTPPGADLTDPAVDQICDDSPERARQWLFLSQLPGFGLRVRRRLAAHVLQLPDLLNLDSASHKAMGLPADVCRALVAWRRDDAAHPALVALHAIESDCERHGIGIVHWQSSAYPLPLRHIHNPPLLLYIRGDTSLLGRDQLAVIGSRHATRAGLDHARGFAAALGECNLLVSSGLALGIDGAAHAGALDAGHPTLAVIGSGLDKIYPRQHQRLGERVIANGLLVSEYPPGTQARPAHFPQRNRIISGLSRGVLVVEAGFKSGSLITARLASEQGRDVFAIPGSVHSPVARGCHQLIRQGATLVESVADILQELGGWWSEPATPGASLQIAATEGLDAREIAVLEALGYDSQSTDVLGSSTGLSADQLMQSLLLLELQGLATAAPGGYVRIA
jgi:DNA processing protein